jgi:peptide deformylase
MRLEHLAQYNSPVMSILKVARMGHPVLRAKARFLDRGDIVAPDTQRLIDDMIETMVEYHGVGLAGPQVHEGVRLFVATLNAENGEGTSEPVAIINPEITIVGGELVEDWEGCLSIPDFRGRVPRYARLRVDALDRHGHKVEFTAEDFFARVIQHEFDHLMGKVYLDRMRDLGTLAHMAEFERYWLPREKKAGSSE